MTAEQRKSAVSQKKVEKFQQHQIMLPPNGSELQRISKIREIVRELRKMSVELEQAKEREKQRILQLQEMIRKMKKLLQRAKPRKPKMENSAMEPESKDVSPADENQ